MDKRDAAAVATLIDSLSTRQDELEASLICTRLLLSAVIQATPDKTRLLAAAEEILSSSMGSHEVQRAGLAQLTKLVALYRAGDPSPP